MSSLYPVPLESQGESFYDLNVNSLAGHSAIVFLYPPSDLYNSDGNTLQEYVSNPNDELVSVDIAFLRLEFHRDDLQDATYNDGEFKGTNVGGAFFAFEEDDYFYKWKGTEAVQTAPPLRRGVANPKIGEALRIMAGSSGRTFANRSLGMYSPNVEKHSDVEVGGLDEGYAPDVMESYAVRLEGVGVEDVTYRCFDSSTLTNNVNTPIGGADVITSATTHFNGINKGLIEATGYGEASNKFITANTTSLYGDAGTTKFSTYVSAIEICNVERDLGDLRYGDEEDVLPFIFTGAEYAFTDAELLLVEAGTEVTKDIDVWGGDCYIGLHTFKITNSVYSLTDAAADFDGSGGHGSKSEQSEKWGHYFDKNFAATGETTTAGTDVNRPIGLKGASQTITVLLESEINPELAEKNQHNEYDYAFRSTTSISNMPVPMVEDAGQIASKFAYRYNLDYGSENVYKVFFPLNTYEKNVVNFDGRIAYSDQKVYLSDAEGFDRFRVLSIYDQNETYGAVSSLPVMGDKLYSIQEKSLSYIPIDADVIESADGVNISIRSGEVIGTPIYIDTVHGTQHPKTVKKDKDTFYFVDKQKSEVCLVTDGGVTLLSRVLMESYFTDMLSRVTTHSDLSAVYDNKKKEYWVTHRNNDTAVYNAMGNVWTARYPEDSSSNTLGGLRVQDKMYVAGLGSAAGVSNLATHDVMMKTVYDTGAIGQWWNTQYTGFVKFYVNPEPEAIKTFDAYNIISTREEHPESFIVYLNDGTQVRGDLTGSNLQYREGSWRDKMPRVKDKSTDGGATWATAPAGEIGKRLRGTHGLIALEFDTANKSGTTSVLTKYRRIAKPV
jgi:hypothetical protein